MEDRPTERSRPFINSLARGLTVIGAFSAEDPAQTLSEVAARTGLARATARRILLTLTELGYTERSGRTFTLTPKTLDLGFAYLSSLRLPDVAEPHMEALVEATRESSSLSVFDGREVVYVARVPTSRIMTISLAVGSRLPAYPTSMGRVLLSGLSDAELDAYLASTPLEPLTSRTVTDPDRIRAIVEQVRADGFALVDQELEDGVRSVAAPVSDRKGRVVAALNISCHAARSEMSTIREDFVPQVIDAAEKISNAAHSITRQ